VPIVIIPLACGDYSADQWLGYFVTPTYPVDAVSSGSFIALPNRQLQPKHGIIDS
jgi:hypothetical protein